MDMSRIDNERAGFIALFAPLHLLDTGVHLQSIREPRFSPDVASGALARIYLQKQSERVIALSNAAESFFAFQRQNLNYRIVGELTAPRLPGPKISDNARKAIALLSKWRREADPKNEIVLRSMAAIIDDERKGGRILFGFLNESTP